MAEELELGLSQFFSHYVYTLPTRRMIMEAGFLRHNIEFQKDEKHVSAVARGLNAIGNFLLSPARCLFNGRTMTLINYTLGGQLKLDYVENSKALLDSGGIRFLKVVASIIGIVPGIILGSAVKGVALVSPALRDRYNKFPQQL
jgi:hypothetical protein